MEIRRGSPLRQALIVQLGLGSIAFGVGWFFMWWLRHDTTADLGGIVYRPSRKSVLRRFLRVDDGPIWIFGFANQAWAVANVTVGLLVYVYPPADPVRGARLQLDVLGWGVVVIAATWGGLLLVRRLRAT